MSTLNKNREFIFMLTDVVNANISNDQFGVIQLAKKVGMSRSNLHRKVKSYTGESVSKFICDVKLAWAKGLLLNSSKTISEIAFESGFRSATYFSKCFRDHYGYPPGEVRKHESEIIGIGNNKTHTEIRGFWKRRISAYYFYSSIVTIILLVVLLIVFRPFENSIELRERSIAVLPFINDGPEESEMYYINGTMEAILNNLCKIEDLSVVSRRTIEQYRNNSRSTLEIAKELNVIYILEGSGQKLGNRIRLTVQLLDARKDRHIWSEKYDRDIEHIEALFDIENEIALLVADAIHARVTPEEKNRIERIPTTNNIAYEFYLKGEQELSKYDYTHLLNNQAIVHRAADLFRYALEYDKAFALAYAGLASAYNYGHYSGNTEDWQDSVTANLERALSNDPQCDLAYYTYGNYYMMHGENAKAIESFEKVLEITPNSPEINEGLIALYYINNDYVKALEHGPKTRFIDKSVILSHTATFLHTMSQVYLRSGFKEQYEYYVEQIFEQHRDSVEYYHYLAQGEYWINNDLLKAMKIYEKAYEIDSGDVRINDGLSQIYYRMGQYAESLRFVEKYLALLQAYDGVSLYGAIMAGIAYWTNGNREMAEYYFDLQMTYCNRLLASDPNMQSHMASIYAFKGEKEKAYLHLRELNRMEHMNIYEMRTINNDLIYMYLWDDEEFQKIRGEITAKYEAEHERVRQWLEENNML